LICLNIQDGIPDSSGFDVFSRKSFVVAMKKKSDTTIAMKLILDVQMPILIQSDNGTEFLNHSFQNLLQAKGVRHITVNVGDHNRQGLIERFNIIKHYQEPRKSNRYVNVWKILFLTTIILITVVWMIFQS
jgi:transposase InsO family protein